jgi:endonuclease/exonuclease/phosphatase (EEP) superfamily protein YafD
MTNIAEAPRTLRKYAGHTMSAALSLLAAGLLSCQTVIWLKPLSPNLSLIEQFAVHLVSLAAIGMFLALVLRRWIQMATLAALASTLAWPVLAAHRPAAEVTDGHRLKVVSANLWFAAPTNQPTIEFLMASDADIVGLIEVSASWQRALAPLFAKYPYKVDCFATIPECETVLLSKLPIKAPRAERVLGGAPVVVGGEVDWNGKRVEVLATHLAWPFTPDYGQHWRVDPNAAPVLEGRLPASRQASQAENLAQLLNTLPPDLVVMGDFNGAPWSRLQSAFSDATRLENAAGWELSWPTMLPWPFRLPIDHVLSRGHLVVTGFSAGPELDSDHFPVIAEIGWRD